MFYLRGNENIQNTRLVWKTIEFLDVLVHTNQKQLNTNVYHKLAAESYIVPFLPDQPRHIHRSTIKGALCRAAHFCSNVKDFNKER